MKKVLIVDDDTTLRVALERYLIKRGFVVQTAASGVGALTIFQEDPADLIVSDILMSEMDGFEFCRRIRASRSGQLVPFIFLSSRSDVEDRVQGHSIGADDYLIKPFAFSELLARVRSVLRRGHERRPEIVRIADLEIDLIRCRAVREGQRLELTPKEFALLSLLVRRSGEVLSRTLIAEQVWDMNFDSDTNVVDTAVRRLRAKLDDPFERKLVHTIRGMGYVLEVRDS